MAKRGTTKWFSIAHEEFIANKYGGRRVANSGATVYEKSDVVTHNERIECKYTGSPGSPAKSISVKVDDIQKAFEAAAESGLDMAMALRIWNPDCVLADYEGWIDLIVRPVSEDLARE